jgi:5-(carboxyamino)imidazole ribonucleotide mutase
MQAAGSVQIAILSQATTDAAILAHVRQTLEEFSLPSVERLIDRRDGLAETVGALEADGVVIFIVANSTAAPLSNVIAGLTTRPVLAVPLEGADLPPLQALQTTLQGGGAPVASLAIGKAGAINAALLAVAILANTDAGLRQKLHQFRRAQTEKVLADRLE